MIGLYRPAAVRAMDERAFAAGVAPQTLMERAAGHLARAVLGVGGGGYGLRVGILCGKGNNGGDGIAAGRLLLDAGAAPRVCLVGGEDSLGPEGRDQLVRYRGAGGRLVSDASAALRGADVAVDALLGTGASGPPRSPYAEAVKALSAAEIPVVACDIPTGVDAATGAVPGAAVRATVTVTLGAEKVGLRLWPARGHCGRIVVGDIGITDPEDRPDALALEPADVAACCPPPPPDAHKRSRGVVVALAGSAGMSGAAILVARGALAGGAGLVTVATSAAARDEVAPTVPEALTVGLVDEDPDAAFEQLAGALEGADALAVGPGLGHAEATVALVRRVVAEVGLPIVLDADGINAFRGEGGALAAHVSPLLTLTPHRRELARIVGEDRWVERLEVCAERAAAWETVVVAKGPGSLVAAPDGRVWVNPTGSPALATGGTGDVLTGLTAALVAARPAPETVASAVWLHGAAGEEAERRVGARSATAGDVAAAMPAAFARADAAAWTARREPWEGAGRRDKRS